MAKSPCHCSPAMLSTQTMELMGMQTHPQMQPTPQLRALWRFRPSAMWRQGAMRGTPTPGTQRESLCTVGGQLFEDSVQAPPLRDVTVGRNQAACSSPHPAAAFLLSEHLISC